MSRQDRVVVQRAKKGQSAWSESLSVFKSGLEALLVLTCLAFKDEKKGVKRKAAPASSDDWQRIPDNTRRTRPRVDSASRVPETALGRRQGGMYDVVNAGPSKVRGAPPPPHSGTHTGPFLNPEDGGLYRRRHHSQPHPQFRPQLGPPAAPRVCIKPLPPTGDTPPSTPRHLSAPPRPTRELPHPPVTPTSPIPPTPPSPSTKPPTRGVRGVRSKAMRMVQRLGGPEIVVENLDDVPPMNPLSPKTARLSVASDSTTASLNRYLQMRCKQRMSIEKSAVQGISILDYERAGSWILKHPLTKENNFKCPIDDCEAHYMQSKVLRRVQQRRRKPAPALIPTVPETYAL